MCYTLVCQNFSVPLQTFVKFANKHKLLKNKQYCCKVFFHFFFLIKNICEGKFLKKSSKRKLCGNSNSPFVGIWGIFVGQAAHKIDAKDI